MSNYNIGPKIGIEGEAEYRSQIQQINTQIKTLGTEMKAVTSAFEGQEKSVESLTAQNEVLNKTVAALDERLELQKKMLQESINAYGEADERTLKWQQTVNLTTAELNKAKAQIAENEKAMEGLGEETDDATESASVFSDVLKADLASEAIKAGIKALASAVREVGDALVSTVKDSAAFADNILTLSTNTGVSTKALQEYQYMAELTDTSVETITGSLAKLTRNMESAKGGTGNAAEAFAALGISVTDTNGELRNNQDVFAEVIDKLGQMENETQRDAYAMNIFGKSAQDLNSLIAVGSDGIAAFAKEAHDMGYVLSDETLGQLGAVDDAFQRLDNFMTATKNTIGAALAPAVTELADSLQEWAASVDWDEVGEDVAAVGGAIKDFVMFTLENGPEIISIVAGIGAGFIAWKIVGIVNNVVGAISTMTRAMTTATTAQEALTVATAAFGGPVGIIITAVAALTAALITAYKTNDEFRAKVDAAWDAIREKIRTVTDWIAKRMDELRSVFALETSDKLQLSVSGTSRGGSFGASVTAGAAGTTVNNFNVDSILTYQQIEQKAINQQRTTRMGYAGPR